MISPSSFWSPSYLPCPLPYSSHPLCPRAFFSAPIQARYRHFSSNSSQSVNIVTWTASYSIHIVPSFIIVTFTSPYSYHRLLSFTVVTGTDSYSPHRAPSFITVTLTFPYLMTSSFPYLMTSSFPLLLGASPLPTPIILSLPSSAHFLYVHDTQPVRRLTI